MQRRTFLQGATASLAAARFASAFAQDNVPPQPGKEPTHHIQMTITSRWKREKLRPARASLRIAGKSAPGLPRLPEPSSPLYDFLQRALCSNR